MLSTILNPDEFNPYYAQYINNAADTNIVEGLNKNLVTVFSFYSNIPKNKHNYAYSDGKWTIKQILIHLIDTERIFAYRALRIARKDKTPLAGFDQDDYVFNATVVDRSLINILDEYKAVRLATIALFESFNKETLLETGIASNDKVSVRALGYIITGHENHHNKIIRERYL
ncbi:MAG: DinB family protein [Winogradskyella sp.]|uniref:DinB family protein n=1 Tax=Winogradskyella sp. TaxID=1883156 RepID=UPI0017F60B28|nr:DinB family protein [Winogradskyella sp.]